MNRAKEPAQAAEAAVVAATAALNAARDGWQDAKAEATRLQDAIVSAASYADAQTLARKAWEANKRAADLAASLPIHEQRLADARRAALLAKLEPLTSEIRIAVEANVAALTAAANSNSAVIAAIDRARTELGDGVALRFIQPSHAVYNGLVREDLVVMYTKHVTAILASFERVLREVSQ